MGAQKLMRFFCRTLIMRIFQIDEASGTDRNKKIKIMLAVRCQFSKFEQLYYIIDKK